MSFFHICSLAGRLAAIDPNTEPATSTSTETVPDWTENPTVTIVSDNDKATLDRIDVSPKEYAAREASWSFRRRNDNPPLPKVHVCRSPCGASVPAWRTYQINGPGITPSQHFVIPPGERVVVRARTGSWPAFLAGTIAMGGGLLGTLGGGAMALSKDDTTRTAGHVVAGISVVALAAAIPLFVMGYTTVEVEEAPRK